jgi:hypothetical protein
MSSWLTKSTGRPPKSLLEAMEERLITVAEEMAVAEVMPVSRTRSSAGAGDKIPLCIRHWSKDQLSDSCVESQVRLPSSV